jgi:hypothetical protein
VLNRSSGFLDSKAFEACSPDRVIYALVESCSGPRILAAASAIIRIFTVTPPGN